MATLAGTYTGFRLLLSMGPGLMLLLILDGAIWLHRPDIVDFKHRVRDIQAEHIYNFYDFIVIGGGTAGTAMAARLSEISDWSVLLLEAGPDESYLSEVPVIFPTLQQSELDWKFKTEKSDKFCLAMNGGQCNWPRGKVLGGCSVLNAMLYVRGNKKDFDEWEELGNPGWSYRDVLPYFKKLEDMRIPELRDSPLHGKGGPITAEFYRYTSPLSEIYMEAAAEMNMLNPDNDLNGATQTGFSRSQGSLRNGLRCSGAKGYLRPARHRPNLHVSLHSMVEKILIDPRTKRAYGVLFTKDKKKHTVFASKEVILSAGAVQSPQILMLSGVGPRKELMKHKIRVIQDSPGVGENLQDHIAAGGGSYLIQSPIENSTLSIVMPKILDIDAIREFTFRERGPMYAMPACEIMAFINTKYQDPAEDRPDIQLFLASFADTSDGGIFGKKASGISDDYYAEVYEKFLYKDAFMILPLLMRPKSRGKILLKNKDPNTPPLIYPNYFDDPIDIKIMVEGAKFAYNLTQTKVFKALNATLNPATPHDCADFEVLSDDFWACLARHYTQTIYHPAGTTKMGPPNDPMAVVDPTLKVYGITNLRVVDCGIMPTITTGNTNIPVFMIAEKAADMIKSEYLGRRHHHRENYNSRNDYDSYNHDRNPRPSYLRQQIDDSRESGPQRPANNYRSRSYASSEVGQPPINPQEESYQRNPSKPNRITIETSFDRPQKTFNSEDNFIPPNPNERNFNRKADYPPSNIENYVGSSKNTVPSKFDNDEIDLQNRQINDNSIANDYSNKNYN